MGGESTTSCNASMAVGVLETALPALGERSISAPRIATSSSTSSSAPCYERSG